MSVISLKEWQKKLGKTLKSKSPSKPNLRLETTGQPRINYDEDPDLTQEVLETLRNLFRLLQYTHRSPYLTKSRFARANAELIALCASEGYITTRIDNLRWGNLWCITDFGIEYLNELEVYDYDD